MKVTKAVLPAAGFGTRMLPAAKSVPKEMINIVDKPAIHYVVEEIVRSGITDILIITNRGKATMEDYFDYSFELEDKLRKSGKEELFEQMRAISHMADITYVRQKEARGLGHAVNCAKDFVGKEPFCVLLGDDIVYHENKPATAQLCEAFEKTGKSVIGVQEVDHAQIAKYGSIRPGRKDGNLIEVLDMVEKPRPEAAFSDYAALGRYVLTPDVFFYLAQGKIGAGGEIQLTDALSALAGKGELYACVFEGRRYDTGSKSGYLEAVVEYALRNPETAENFRAYLKDIAGRL